MSKQKHPPISVMIKEIQEKFNIVGREIELRKALAAKLAGKHLLLEGDVGVGKTTLAHAIAEYFSQIIERVDGDERYNSARLVGYFDPPMVIEKGYMWDSFVAGPLVTAMINGSILFLNEINRMPEGTQNVLLVAMDEGVVNIPKLGSVKAKEGFYIIAAMNPQEFVATTPLSEALKDRFAWIRLEYQNEEEERQIVKVKTGITNEKIIDLAVRAVRLSRDWPELRRGSSIRGALDFASIMENLDPESKDDWIEAGIMALATKVELEDGVDKRVEDVIIEIIQEAIEQLDFM